MPFVSQVDASRGLVVTTGREPATDVELEQLVDALTSRPDFDPCFDRLVDFRSLKSDFFSPAGAERFVARARGVAQTFLACGKSAIVVSTDAVFGTVRVIQTLLARYPRQVRIFRDMESARQWLDVRDESTGR